MNTDMIRNAKVTGVLSSEEKTQKTTITITIDDKYQHQFPSTSRVVTALETASLDDIVEQLDGGSFFFVDGEVIEWKYANYQGFVHTDESIKKLIDVVGITRSDSDMEGVSRNAASRTIKLSSEFSREGFNIDQFANGAGDFTTALHFGWSPFSQNVNSAFILWRLTCANGMRGMTSFLNSQVPLINNWEEHLDIANTQLMNKINAKMDENIRQLQNRRATVADCLLINKHITERSDALHNAASVEATQRLNAIQALVNPVLHLAKHYKPEVFTDGAMASKAPAHITGYDFFNMVTEVRTHTEATAESTGHALDVVANQLMFGTKASYGYKVAQGNVEQKLAAEKSPILLLNDPERAFFGK